MPSFFSSTTVGNYYSSSIMSVDIIKTGGKKNLVRVIIILLKFKNSLPACNSQHSHLFKEIHLAAE